MAVRIYKQISGFNRETHHRSNHRVGIGNHQLVRVLAVTLGVMLGGFVPPSWAKEEGTNVIANPQASSTGSVTNSNVQINQGSYSTQGYNPGHYCNSGTLVFTPFYLGGAFHPNYTRTENFGLQVSFSIPLDRQMLDYCKDLANKRIQQTQVDILLTRIRECVKMYEKGYMVHPSSPFALICDDVVPIASVTKSGSVSPVVP